MTLCETINHTIESLSTGNVGAIDKEAVLGQAKELMEHFDACEKCTDKIGDLMDALDEIELSPEQEREVGSFIFSIVASTGSSFSCGMSPDEAAQAATELFGLDA